MLWPTRALVVWMVTDLDQGVGSGGEEAKTCCRQKLQTFLWDLGSKIEERTQQAHWGSWLLEGGGWERTGLWGEIRISFCAPGRHSGECVGVIGNISSGGPSKRWQRG